MTLIKLPINIKGMWTLFIYIGNYHVVESKYIISILDVQLEQTSSKLQRLIDDFKQKDKLYGDEESAKSIVITDDVLYYSPLSTLTLKKTKKNM